MRHDNIVRQLLFTSCHFWILEISFISIRVVSPHGFAPNTPVRPYKRYFQAISYELNKFSNPNHPFEIKCKEIINKTFYQPNLSISILIRIAWSIYTQIFRTFVLRGPGFGMYYTRVLLFAYLFTYSLFVRLLGNTMYTSLIILYICI